MSKKKSKASHASKRTLSNSRKKNTAVNDRHIASKNSKDASTKNLDAPLKKNILGKVIIVHGWDSDISKGWHPWLKQALESQSFEVIMRQMPHTNAPSINEWVEALNDISGKIDKDTYFIGHSIGCQTILRTLEKHDTGNVGGAIFIAGWFDLKDMAYKENPQTKKASRSIARPWIENSIDFKKVQSKFSPERIIAIFSDNDPYVDINNARIFKDKLGARIIVENAKGHYTPEDNANSLPIVVEEFLRMVKGPIVVNTEGNPGIPGMMPLKEEFNGTIISGNK